MDDQMFEQVLMKKYGTAFSTIAKFAGLEVHDVLTGFEKRIKQ